MTLSATPLQPTADPSPQLQIRALACRRGARRLFSGLELSASPGTLIEVSGANGSGKTSLLRVLAGLAAPERGELSWAGIRSTDDPQAWRSRIAWLGHAMAVRDDLDAAENLAFADALAGEAPGQDRVQPRVHARVQDALGRLGIDHRAGVPARLLSAGQRRRVALAGLVLTRRPWWILDEPFSALDRAATQVLVELIEEHLVNGGIVVLTTHQVIRIDAPYRITIDLDQFASGARP
jgi:heme exporter protein A